MQCAWADLAKRTSDYRKCDTPFGASSVKKGPRMLLSVAVPTGGLLSASTSAVTPSTLESRTNSWRSAGTRVRNSMAVIHSSGVILMTVDCTKYVRQAYLVSG